MAFMADLLPSTGHIPLAYVMGYDTRPLLTLDEKKTFLNAAADNEWVLFLEHDAVNAACTVQHTPKGVRLPRSRALLERADGVMLLPEPLHNAGREAWPFVNHARVDLNQTRSSLHLLSCRFGAINAANANDGEPSMAFFRQVPHNFSGPRLQWNAGNPTSTHALHLFLRCFQPLS